MFCRPWVLAAIALTALRLVCPGELLAQQNPDPDRRNQATPPSPNPEWVDILPQPLPKTPVATVPNFSETKFPNFASCPIAEVQLAVPELVHLKTEQDQSQLAALLDKIGDQTVEMAGKTPNLISHEVVISEQNGSRRHADYSFLILQHPMGKDRVFDEYRVDAATGEKLQTDFTENARESAAAPASSPVLDLLRVRPVLAEPITPVSLAQGFISAWLYFYPSNREEFEFRYLGQEKMDRRQTLVVAFAQKPGSVQLPAEFEYNGQTYSIFMQGVAWIDPVEFRILRLRSDLLSVPAALPLYRLSVEIQFAQIPVGVQSPLWLPTQAVITTNLIGSAAIRERHMYSNYRLFLARSRIVMK